MAPRVGTSARSNAADTLRDKFGIDDVDEFWQAVDTNLQAERFRLVFVSDSIGAELRRIIETRSRRLPPRFYWLNGPSGCDTAA